MIKRKEFHIFIEYLSHDNKIEPIFQREAPFGIAFGGQMEEIQRIVFGADSTNRIELMERVGILFHKYRELLQNYLTEKGITEELPKIDTFGDELALFKDWRLTGFGADWGDFSNQNAIECVNWFVGIMIKSHQFTSNLPTVGGEIHLGLITKDKGFTSHIKRKNIYMKGMRHRWRKLRHEYNCKIYDIIRV